MAPFVLAASVSVNGASVQRARAAAPSARMRLIQSQHRRASDTARAKFFSQVFPIGLPRIRSDRILEVSNH